MFVYPLRLDKSYRFPVTPAVDISDRCSLKNKVLQEFLSKGNRGKAVLLITRQSI